MSNTAAFFLVHLHCAWMMWRRYTPTLQCSQSSNNRHPWPWNRTNPQKAIRSKQPSTTNRMMDWKIDPSRKMYWWWKHVIDKEGVCISADNWARKIKFNGHFHSKYGDSLRYFALRWSDNSRQFSILFHCLSATKEYCLVTIYHNATRLCDVRKIVELYANNG